MREACLGMFLVFLIVGSIFSWKSPQLNALDQTVDDWPTFQHDCCHTGVSDAAGPKTASLLWEHAAKGGSSPIVAEGMAYVDGDVAVDGFGILCLDAFTGSVIWNSSGTGDWIACSPAFADGKVYAESDIGICCLDAYNGSEIWRQQVGARPDGSSPTVCDGVLFVASFSQFFEGEELVRVDAIMHAFDANTGTEKWRFTLSRPGPETDYEFSSPAISDGMVYFGSDDSHVYALNAANGELVWNCSTSQSIYASPTVSGGAVYIGNKNGDFYALNSSNGEIMWVNSNANAFDDGAPAISNSILYLRVLNLIRAINISSGQTLWDYPTDSWQISRASPAVADGVVYTGAGTKMYALDALSGNLLWDYPLGNYSYINSAPAIVTGILYVNCWGSIMAFSDPITLHEPPVAEFSFAPLLPEVNKTILFFANASFDPDGFIVDYQWNFGDNSFGQGYMIRHIYTSVPPLGACTVKLTVTDNEGLYDIETKQIRIFGTAQPPVANFVWSPTSPETGEWVVFNASSSNPGSGDITKYSWNFSDGVVLYGKIATRGFSTPGTYTVKLNVTNSMSLSAINQKTISVSAPAPQLKPPTAKFTFSPTNPVVDKQASFDGSSSYDPDGSIVEYKWIFSDGIVKYGKTATRSFSSAGSYTVILRVKDNDGQTGSTQKTVTVVKPQTDGRIEKAISWALSNLGSNKYNYYCLKFVQDAYQIGAHTYITRYGSAKEAADALAAYKNKGIPPRGAFVFYNWWGIVNGIYRNWGHVGLSLGNGYIVHAYDGHGVIKSPYLKYKVDGYIGWAWPPLKPAINTNSLSVSTTCPVDLVVTDPSGLTVCNGFSEVQDAVYLENDFNGDGMLDDYIVVPDRKPGEYAISVIPEPDADPNATYTLEVSFGPFDMFLAQNASIVDIPSDPYVVESPPWETDFAEPSGNPIVDFAYYDGNLYASASNYLYVYNASSWIEIGVPTYVISIEPYADKLIVGGQGGLYYFDGTAVNLIFTVQSYIRVLGEYNGRLYAGTMLDRSPTLYYCSGLPDNSSDWHVDTEFQNILNFTLPFASIDSFEAYDGKLYIGSGGTVYSFDGTHWNAAKTYDDVYAFLDMQVYNGKLYLATRDQGWRKPMYLGSSGFSGRVIEFDGENWTTILDHDYWIFSLEPYNNELYAGTADKILIYDGTEWNVSFNAVDGAYYTMSLIVSDGKIYAGMGNGFIFSDPIPENATSSELRPTLTVPEFSSTAVMPLLIVFSLYTIAYAMKRARRKLET